MSKFSRCLFLSSVCAIAASSLCAQSASKPSGGVDAREVEQANARAVIDDAKHLSKESNPNAAEQALLKLNRAKAGSGEWHVEAARRLMHLAQDVRREGRAEAGPALIASALGHLQQADALLKDPRQKAAAHALAGFIQERFAGDRTAARASYEAAIALAPEKAAAAKEAVGRLREEDKRVQLLNKKSDAR